MRHFTLSRSPPSSILVAACGWWLAACGSPAIPTGACDAQPDGTACGSALACRSGACVSTMASATVGTPGGTIQTAAGAKVEVRFGALDGATTIGLSATDRAAPAGIAAVSPVYEFLPSGSRFARPMKITLPLPPGVTTGSIYWSRLDGSGFDAIGGTVDPVARTITVESPHFSEAVIGPAVTTRTVMGSAMVTFVTPSARVSLPLTSDVDVPEAIVKDGSGAYVTLPGAWGTGASEGTFTIPDVPVGEYILHLGMSYLVTSTSSPDLGYTVSGKPVSQRTELGTSSFLDLTVSNLDAWDQRDQIQFMSPQVAQMDVESQRWVDPLVLEDPVETAELHMDLWEANYITAAYLIEGSKGDNAYVSQLSYATSGGGKPYWAMSRLGKLPAFDASNDGTTRVPVSVALVDVSQGHQLALDFRGSQWAGALALDGNPKHDPTCPADGNFYSCEHSFNLISQGGSAEDGQPNQGTYLDLLLLQDRSSAGTDFQTGIMTYGAPLASTQEPDWGVLAVVGWSMPVKFLLEGSTIPAELADGLGWVTSVASAQAGPIVPPVTPATAITVAGLPFFAGGQGIGLTPTVSWSPPRVGRSDMYSVAIREVFVKPWYKWFKTAAPILFRIRTPHTSVEIPPGILVAGKTYVFQMEVGMATSPESLAIRVAAPRKSSIDSAGAVVISGVFSP